MDDSPLCTTDCVARCGSLAELPRTVASQLVGCFEETCGCRNKWIRKDDAAAFSYLGEQDEETDADLMRQYFDLIHNRERIDYLVLQQGVVDRIVAADSMFLAESDIQLIKKRLNTEEGARYYETYLGDAKKMEVEQSRVYVVALHVLTAAVITAGIVLVCRFFWSRLNLTKRD